MPKRQVGDIYKSNISGAKRKPFLKNLKFVSADIKLETLTLPKEIEEESVTLQEIQPLALFNPVKVTKQ